MGKPTVTWGKLVRDKISKLGILFKNTFSEFVEDNVMMLGAALSYYTIFSLPPLLIIIISISGVFFGEEAVRGQLFHQINGMVGNEAALQIQEAIKNVRLSGSTTLATIASLIILLIGASGVFAEIQNSINLIWGIKAKPKKGLIRFLKNRLISFSMIGAVGFLLMVGLIINMAMDILHDRLTTMFPVEFVYLFLVLNYVAIFAIITTLFSIIFKTLPDGKVATKDCVVGAFFTAFLFILGKFAIGFYLGKSSMITIYGAAGSLILILVWVYYSAVILYFGAEFTKVFAQSRGNKIVPNDYSVKFIRKDVEFE